MPNVTSIGRTAFEGCKSLTNILLPDSLTSMDYAVFSQCKSLTIYCKGNSQPSGWVADWNKYNLPVVWDCDNNDVADDGCIYTVINGVRYALKDDSATIVKQPKNLISAKILPRVTYKNVEYATTGIVEGAFKECDVLTDVVISGDITFVGKEAFFQWRERARPTRHPARSSLCTRAHPILTVSTRALAEFTRDLMLSTRSQTFPPQSKCGCIRTVLARTLSSPPLRKSPNNG